MVTTNSPLISFEYRQAISLKLPYYTNFNTINPEERFQGYFVDPSVKVPGAKAMGQILMYIAQGGNYLTTISNVPCVMPEKKVSGQCLTEMYEHSAIRFQRHDSATPNSLLDASGLPACKLPQPDLDGYLYVTMKQVGPYIEPVGATPTGCTTHYCVGLLPRSES
jgi:hypothetical protein